jgi:2-polyprenyl-6-hydroxyphenyl methylase/3-demethylubiquinone-9 3-methyltransferase
MSEMHAEHQSAEVSSQTTSTAAPDEIAKFSQIAQEWWDPNGSFRPLHDFTPIRVEYLKHSFARQFGRDLDVARPFEGLTLLDVGCGGGLMTEPMCRLGFSVVGIDASAEAINIATEHAQAQGLDITYINTTPEKYAEKHAQADAVISLDVVEHVPDVQGFLAACSENVRMGGAMIVTTINKTWKSYVFAKLMAEYVLRMVPKGTHDHARFIRPAYLKSNMAKAGLNICGIRGFKYKPSKKEWSLDQDVSINYAVYGAKPKIRAHKPRTDIPGNQ